MKAVGLVVEYNPFHNGHRYHAEQAKIKTDSSVAAAVMSGLFCSAGNRPPSQSGPDKNGAGKRRGYRH